MAKIDYDKEGNILNIKLKNTKVIDTDVRGNCVLDFDSKGDVVNIEIMDYNLEEAICVKKT